MANTVISIRSSGVTGNTPSLGVLANGELSLNFADGVLYYKTAANALGSIRTTQPSGLNQEIQFNDSGSFGANADFTFNKSTGYFKAPIIESTNNGNGTNFKIGDDTWIGDVNLADTLRIAGQQNVNNAYIVFGAANANTLGRAGTGPLTYTGAFTATETLSGKEITSTQSSGDEGGQINLALAATNTTLNNSVAIDIFQNKLRIFETGGTNRGVFIDMANSASAGVGTDLLNPTATPDTVARATANAAYTHANGAFDKANSANVLAQSGYNQANTATTTAQAAFDKANQTAQLAFTTVSANGTSLVADANNDTLTITSAVANGIFVTGISGTDTLDIGLINSGVTASGYGDSISVPTFVVDAKGRLTSASNTTIRSGTTSQTGVVRLEDSVTSISTSNAATPASVKSAYDLATTANVNAVNAGTYANAAFAKANSANVLAQAAFDSSNTKFASSGGSITGDVSVSGNLTIIGQTIYANTTTALIADNILTLNAAINQAAAPVSDAGIEIDRGSSANVSLLWNESTDKWTFTNDGTTYYNIADAGRLDSVFSLANGTAGVANTDYTFISATAGVYGNASHVPVTTLTANGRVSSIVNTPISIATSQITSGVLPFAQGGTNATSYTTGTILTSNGTAIVSLANTGTAGTYANATHVPVITTDAYGRVSAVTNTAISFPVTSVAGVTGAVSNTQLISGIIAVDGSGSGLDADLLDGLQGASYANATFAQAAFDKANQSAQLAFTTVAANGVNVVADANNDTLTLSAANGVGITADASSDTITINLTPTGVTSGTYGGATQIPTFVVDTQGRLTSAANVAISTNLTIAADTGLNSIALASDTLTFVGGDGITSSIGPTDNVRFDVDNTVIRTSGNQTITGNLSITGNLNVIGNTVVTNVASLVINDPLIQLAANNETSDAVDIGFFGHYSDDGGTSLRHAGLFRDTSSSDKRFILFTNLIDQGLDNSVAITVNTAQTSFATANLQTNIIGGRVSGLTQAIAIADGGTNTTSFNTGNLIFFNGTSLAAIANTGTAGTYANASHVPVITTDAYGRVSSVTNTSIAIDTSQLTTGTIADARLPTKGTAGTYANANHVPVITTDAYGRVTAVTNTAIAIDTSQITSGVLPFTRGGSNNTTYTTGAILTSNGTAFVALSNTGTAGTYGNASHVAVVTTDAYGRVSAVTNTLISITSAQHTGVHNFALGGTNATTYTTGTLLVSNGTAIVSLANTGTAGTYANASHVPVITTDAYGRVSTVSNTSIAIAASQVTSGAFDATRLPTTGTAGTYANASHVPVITTDVYGRVSSVSNTLISITSAQHTGVHNFALGGTNATTYTTGTLLTSNGTAIVSLANTGTAGTYGNATHVPIITTDAYGRVSSITTSQITGGGGGGTQNVTIATFNTTANGATLTYDLGFNPVAANAIFVTIDGVVQPESTYSVNTTANTITFNVEPANTENVRVVAFATTNPYIIPDGSIDPSKLSVSTNNFILATALDASVALAIALG